MSGEYGDHWGQEDPGNMQVGVTIGAILLMFLIQVAINKMQCVLSKVNACSHHHSTLLVAYRKVTTFIFDQTISSYCVLVTHDGQLTILSVRLESVGVAEWHWTVWATRITPLTNSLRIWANVMTFYYITCSSLQVSAFMFLNVIRQINMESCSWEKLRDVILTDKNSINPEFTSNVFLPLSAAW